MLERKLINILGILKPLAESRLNKVYPQNSVTVVFNKNWNTINKMLNESVDEEKFNLILPVYNSRYYLSFQSNLIENVLKHQNSDENLLRLGLPILLVDSIENIKKLVENTYDKSSIKYVE